MHVTEPRDEIDSWLGHEVEPLAPPPGTFERIHGRARRRKLNQALITAAGAVVVIAAAALTPTLASGLLHGGSSPQRTAALGSATPASHAARPAASATASLPPIAASPAPSATGGTGLSDTTSGTSAPASFRPTSITMVGAFVGAVIGQAGTPGQCASKYCTSLAGTSSYGASWYGVSAPPSGAPDGATGVGQLRFLNLNDGWAFGPQLYVTTDGGRSWSSPVPTHGLRVTDLEAAGNNVLVLLARCRGGGSAYASDCSSFELYTSVAGSTTWQPVSLKFPPSVSAASRSGVIDAGQASSATLVIAHSPASDTGYLLSPSGAIFSGPVSGGTWTYVRQAPCGPGAAASDGQPLGAQMSAGAGQLLLDCTTGSTVPQAKQLYASADGGATWKTVGQPPADGLATALAGTSQGQMALGTTAGIDYSADGKTWQPATISGGSPAGGFSYVGMTTATDGVALPAEASLGEVFVTANGGQTWTAARISGS
jgi:hypothetical protein